MNESNEKVTAEFVDIQSYRRFAEWFRSREEEFFEIVKSKGNVQPVFDELTRIMVQVIPDCGFQTKLISDTKASLIITAGGIIKNIAFVENLVMLTPAMTHWELVAHIPEAPPGHQARLKVEDDIEINTENLCFTAVDDPFCPDQISLIFTHPRVTEDNKESMVDPVFTFLQNLLGDIAFFTTIDGMRLDSETKGERIPVIKLRDYLIWRQSEFAEKYEDVFYEEEMEKEAKRKNSALGMMYKLPLENGNELHAFLNPELLSWEDRIAYPWILMIQIRYIDNLGNGQPDDYQRGVLVEMNKVIEEDMSEYCSKALKIGRITSDGCHEYFFASKEFRNISREGNNMVENYINNMAISYKVFRDKYWRTFDFVNMVE